MHQVTLIPGEGIGPEVTAAARGVLDASGARIEWEVVQAGAQSMEVGGSPLPEQVLDSFNRTRVALKGPITTPIGQKDFRVNVEWTGRGGKPGRPRSYPSVNVALRKEFDLYANLRPIRIYPGIRTRYDQVDLVVVRENTEDLYMGLELMVTPDVAEAIKIITRAGSERIVRFAFEYAIRHGRRKVTAIHKSNILKLSDGLFLEVAREVAGEYPQVEFEDRIVDTVCMQLVQTPEAFDILVAPNLYGDIISDLCAQMVGGLGFGCSGNIGKELAVFEPTHGSAPKYAGMNKVNPIATVLAAKMMLDWLGESEKAARLEEAVATVIAEGAVRTYDMGGTSTTGEMAEAIATRL